MKKLFDGNGLRKVKLSEIATIRRGASPRPILNKAYFSDSGRGWIRIEDVTSSYKYLNKTSQYLSDLGASKSVSVNKGDLIMSICATIGKPIIVNIPACIHDGFVLFGNIDDTKYDREYLFYALQSIETDFLRKKQSGTQGNLNTTLVGKTEIFVPKTIEEQRKIVEVFSTLDKKLSLQTTQKHKLERIKRGLMNDLLTGKKRVNS
ncbi:MAG: restriction endonuclease subunit S [Candidatus Diapherotrites archaeon]|uniref:Restriction endonuclease subunit S n=1 Tax=Candidatus Iainarchaeum sp. TaxID=3101447 RepID=A0A8T3YMY9_9ARCH|nr:restriction endonuclease subunit S [Candidatus Diapherotrites archaeon]